MSRNVQATIDQNHATDFTTITIRVSKQDEADCPPAPGSGSFGDDWICLQDSNVTEELGYWQIEPEGVAMHLLRAAWHMAHKELRAKNAPFDGEPVATWDKSQ